MAEKNEDLIFGMKLDVDPGKFGQQWPKIEADLQKIIDAKPLKARIEIDSAALKDAVAQLSKIGSVGAPIKKAAKETEDAVEGSIRAIQNLSKATRSAAFDLPVPGNTKIIDDLIIKSRELTGSVKSLSNAAMPLNDILNIGGKNPTGLQLKSMRDELQRFISAEKEGSKDAIIANEKLLAVKERIRNMYGKQESALKATDEEKKINETISAYKRLESELIKINARVRTRASIESGKVIPASGVSVSTMGTQEEAAIYKEIAAAMDRYKASLSAANQERLKATPLESAKREIDLNNQNLSIQNKINKNIAQQSALWQRYDQILQKPENTITQINSKLNQLANLRPKLNMDDKQIKDAALVVSNLQTRLAALNIPSGSMSSKLSALNKQWTGLTVEQRTGDQGKAIIAQYRELNAAAGKSAGTLKSAAKEQDKLTAATDRASRSVSSQNAAYKTQRGLLNGMPQMMNSYISILGAYRLGKNIIDTTAEFEMQRVALAAIIQNKTKADELFAQSVEMGIESPFLIKDIITYTKQLAAYRIETDKLFDTTKRLADISAGLGVGMDRLILAYGQVKAASVLRGQELRQFTEAGIPLVELLAEKFTKLNGKMTTTADVFDLIRARGVSFEMVKEIFEDMTNEGGMFNNMQAIQAQTLKGSMSNLRDAMDKTFMQMGEGAKGPIKDLVDGLRYLMENWRAVSDVVTTGVAIWGTAKLASIAYNKAIGQETASIIANTMAEKRQEAVRLQRLGATRALTVTEQLYIATSRKMTMADWRSLAAKGQLTPLMLMQAVATKRLTVAQGEMLGATIGVSSAEIAQAASKKKLIVYTKLFTAALKVQLVALRTTMAALLSNPFTWIAVAAAGIIKLVSSIRKYNKEYTDMAADMRKQSTALAGSMTDSYKKMSKDIEAAFGKGASEQAMMSTRKSMQDILEKNELIGDLLAARLSGLLTEKERLEAVRDMWNEVHAAAKNDPGYMSTAQKGTGGFMNDDVVENAENVAKKLNEINSYLAKTSAKGYNVSGVRKEFDRLREEFDAGSLSINQFSSALLGMMIDNKGSLDGKVFDQLNRKVKDTRSALLGFEYDMTSMAKVTIAQIGEIDGKMPVFGVDKFGLSDKSLGKLQSSLATQTNFWLQSLGDIDAGAKRLLTTQMKLRSQFPFTKPVDDENPYAKSYNDFLEKKGLNKVSPMDLKDMEKSDATQLEVVSDALKEAEDRLKRYNAQVAAGNNINKDKIATTKEDIRQLKLAWSFLGGTEKGKQQKKADPRIATLSNQLKTLREAYSKYLDIRKDIGDAAARSEITALYGGLTGGMALAFSGSELEAASKKIEAAFATLGEDATDELRDAILKRTDASFDEIAANFKRNLDEMGRKIEQTQRANEFFEKMLGLTGSEEAAARIIKAMGMSVGDVYSGIKDSLVTIMGDNYIKGVDLGNVNQVQNAINKMRQDGFETAANAAQEQINQLVKYNESILEELYSGTDKYQDYKDKLLQIELDYQKRLKIIAQNEQAGTITSDVANIERGRAGKTRIGSIAALDLETLQGTEDYTRAFENLDSVATSTLQRLYDALVKIRNSGALDPDKLKTVTDQMEKLNKMMTERSGFTGLKSSINAVTTAYKKLSGARKEYDQASKEAEAAESAYRASLVKLKDGLSKASGELSSMNSLVNDTTGLVGSLGSALGAPFSDETNEYIKAFTDGIGIATSAISVMTSAVALLETTMLPLLAVAAVLGVLFMAIKAVNNAIDAKKERQVKRYTDSLESLSDGVERLNNALKDSVGSEYVKNIHDQIAATEEMIRLTEQQIEVNKKIQDKGRKIFSTAKQQEEAKKASETIKELSKDVEKYKNEIADLERTLNQELTGFSGPIDAAYAFADAWYEAWLSMDDTTDAIMAKFDEMVDSMIVKSLLAEVVAAKLEPLFAKIRLAYTNDNKLDLAELAGIQSDLNGLAQGLNADLSAIMGDWLKTGGKDRRDGKQGLTGISASVSSMSEDTAKTLGGYLNSGLRQWVLQTGFQGRIAVGVESVQKPLLDIYAMQGQSLAAINSIKSDTAIMVSKLTRLVDNQDSTLISGGQKAVNVRLIN